MRTIENPADPIRQLVSREQPVGLDHLALAVDPLGLYGIQPRTLFRQQAAYDPHSAATLFDSAVVRGNPSSDLFGVCQLALSQIKTYALLPAASSFSQHHARKQVVIPLTGRSSTKRSHTFSNSGR
jgi:hypothetical protein